MFASVSQFPDNQSIKNHYHLCKYQEGVPVSLILYLWIIWNYAYDRFHYRDYQFYQKDWVLNNLSLREEDNFHLLSAVLAGDNTLEMRVLSPYDITITEEMALNRLMCRLMDSQDTCWKK